MSQIFLSYASEDRDRVIPLVQALQSDGYSVWWDRDIRPGPSFDREIEKAIEEAGCVVVLWSSASIDSEWVRSEVEEGVRKGILVPAIIEDVLPPLAYRRRQSADLSGWRGERDGEYRKLLTGIEAALSQDVTTATTTPTKSSRRRARLRVPSMGVLTSVLLAFAAGAMTIWTTSRGTESADTAQPIRFGVELPDGVYASNNVGSPLRITPDGSRIIVNAQVGTVDRRLYVRSLDSMEALPLAGIDDTNSSVLGSIWVTPAGDWVVYNDGNAREYRKISVAGGAPVPVADTNIPGGGIRGLTVAVDGTIVYANIANDGLMVLRPSATNAVQLTTPQVGRLHADPEFIPGTRELLFAERPVREGEGKSQVMWLNLADGEQKSLLEGAYPRITASGHLLYQRGDMVWATAFDLHRREVYGKQAPVLEAAGDRQNGHQFDVSANGTLVYIATRDGAAAASDRKLVWVHLDGSEEELDVPLTDMTLPALAPDDSALVVMASPTPTKYYLWTHAFDRQATTRLTFQANLNVGPQWTPDGKHIVYWSGDTPADLELVIRSSDGTGGERALAQVHGVLGIPSLTADGKAVVFPSCDPGCDIARVAIDGNGESEILLQTPASEQHLAVSPDGRWVAFVTDERGDPEVNVRPYPDLDDGLWQVSSNGGTYPVWSRDSKRLYFVEPTSNMLMAAAVEAGTAFRADRPRPLLDMTPYIWSSDRGNRNFSFDRQEQRLLTFKSSGGNRRIHVVLNWFEELERLVPTQQ